MSQVTIVRGEDRTFSIILRDEKTDAPYDLTSYTAISVSFKKTDGTALTKSNGSGVSISSTEGGKLSVTLSDTETASLKEGAQPIYVTVDKGSDKRIITKGLEKAVNVVSKPF